MKKYIITLLLLISIILPVISTSTVQAEENTPAKALEEAEIEREKTLIKELTLNIPEQTEDPSYPITFIDPSGKGVDIVIDGKTTTKAPSPFILPNLAIGEHIIAFSYKNKSGEPRYLQKDMLITPKAPVFDTSLKTSIVRPSAVVLQGTALPKSTVMLIVNSSYTHNITTSTEGRWEFILPQPSEGKNSVMAFTIRNGIVSTPSKVFTFTYALQKGVTAPKESTIEKKKDLNTIWNDTLYSINRTRLEDPTFFYGVSGIASLLIILLIGINARKKSAKRKDEKTIKSLFNRNEEKDSILNVISTQKKEKSTDKPKDVPKPAPKKKGITKEKKTTKKIEASNKEKKVEKKMKSPIFSVFNKKDKDITKEPEEGKKNSKKPTKKDIKPKEIKEAKSEKKVEKKVKKKVEKKVIEPKQIVDETEEPEKKVLTKEEFLKQFKSGEDD